MFFEITWHLDAKHEYQHGQTSQQVISGKAFLQTSAPLALIDNCKGYKSDLSYTIMWLHMTNQFYQCWLSDNFIEYFINKS